MKYIKYIIVLLLFTMQDVAWAQQRITVTGTVYDASSGKRDPLSSVTILSNGLSIGSTDNNGKFSINVPNNATLVFRTIGYDNKTVKVENKTSLTVGLTSSSEKIAEVTVTSGYQTKSRTLNTGSAVTISGKDIQGQPAGDVMSLLQGKVAGLNIQNNTGAPGFRGSVTIRGISNINVTGNGNNAFLTPTSPYM